MKKIHLINSEMGGMGKSLFCSLLYEYCQQTTKNISIKLIDADRSLADVGIKYFPEEYKNGAFIYFSEIEREWKRADDLYGQAFKENLLVNLPSKILPIFNNWMEVTNILELSVESNIAFTNWFLTNGSYNSILLFKNFVNQYKNNMTHILVKNEGLCNNWKYLETDYELNEIINKYKIESVLIPALDYDIKYLLDRYKMTFTRAKESTFLNKEQQDKIKVFINQAFNEIETISIKYLL